MRHAIVAASAVVVLAGMHAASTVIGPVLLALLITIAWSPASQWLQEKGMPPTIAALTGIVIGIGAILLFALLVWSSLVQLQGNLPGYQDKLSELRDIVAAKLSELPIDSSKVLSSEIVQPGTVVSYTVSIISRLTSAAGHLSILVLIMAFLMIESVRYPQKLYDGTATFRIASVRIDAFAQSLRSYVVINTIFGLIAAVINTILMVSLGVDLALLWGVVSFMFSFLPNIGFVLALIPPTVLALLEFGIARALIVVIGFIVINFIVDNVIKPRFVGESLDLSPAVVVLSLVFWGWLLGPVGALLAVPLSITARFLFEGVPELRWIAHLMSDQNASLRNGSV